MSLVPRVLEIRAQVLSKNDEIARALRQRLRAHGIFTLNLVLSPGSGKTRLLEGTLARLVGHGVRVHALVGDLATDNDARRLARSGAPSTQILTQGRCHLEAEIDPRSPLHDWDLDGLRLLFIENVGNLVCPSELRPRRGRARGRALGRPKARTSR